MIQHKPLIAFLYTNGISYIGQASTQGLEIVEYGLSSFYSINHYIKSASDVDMNKPMNRIVSALASVYIRKKVWIPDEMLNLINLIKVTFKRHLIIDDC